MRTFYERFYGVFQFISLIQKEKTFEYFVKFEIFSGVHNKLFKNPTFKSVNIIV